MLKKIIISTILASMTLVGTFGDKAGVVKTTFDPVMNSRITDTWLTSNNPDVDVALTTSEQGRTFLTILIKRALPYGNVETVFPSIVDVVMDDGNSISLNINQALSRYVGREGFLGVLSVYKNVYEFTAGSSARPPFRVSFNDTNVEVSK